MPTRLTFNADQIAAFGTPKELEAVYAKRTADINENYISQINTNFRDIWDICQHIVKNGAFTGVWAYSDVTAIRAINEHNSIDLRNISVRPCFEGYSMFTIVVYQLLKIAYALNKPFVCVRNCLPKTVAIMKYKFERFSVFEIDVKKEKYDDYPDCYLHTNKVRLTAADLGISHRIIESNESCLIQLDPRTFPTAGELNDDDYVETHFRLR